MQCFAKIVNGYDYFHMIKLFSQYQLSRSRPYEINMNFFKTVLIFTPEVSILRKKVGEPNGSRVMNFDIPNC